MIVEHVSRLLFRQSVTRNVLQLFRGGDILLVESEIQADRFTDGLVARVHNAISIDEYREKFIHSIVIHVNENRCWRADLVDALRRRT